MTHNSKAAQVWSQSAKPCSFYQNRITPAAIIPYLPTMIISKYICNSFPKPCVPIQQDKFSIKAVNLTPTSINWVLPFSIEPTRPKVITNFKTLSRRESWEEERASCGCGWSKKGIIVGGGPVVPVSKRSLSSKLIYHFSEKTRKILNFIWRETLYNYICIKLPLKIIQNLQCPQAKSRYDRILIQLEFWYM